MSKQKVFIEIPITSRLPEGGKEVTWIKKDGRSIWGHIDKSTFFNGKKFKNIISYLSIEESMYIEKYTKIEEIVSWLEEKELNVFTDKELKESYREIMNKDLNGFCVHCNTPIKIELCCDGYMCGCQGQPIEPPICSEYCYYMAYPHMKENDSITEEQMEEYKIKRDNPVKGK